MHWLKKKINALELYTIDVILGRRADTGAAIYGACLQSLSWLFNGIVQARWWLYRHRIFHDQPLGCLVVVVGNLTVGGTGKTPVVEKFAKALRDPEMVKTLAGLGVDPVGDTPVQFGTYIRTESERWQKLISSSGIKID
jgi:hypothetical protein